MNRTLHIVVTVDDYAEPVGFKIQRGRWRPRLDSKSSSDRAVAKYHQWQNWLGSYAVSCGIGQGWIKYRAGGRGKASRMNVPAVYRLGVAVFLEPTKAGRLTRQGMDWTNFHKGAEDALVRAGVLPGDSAYHSRGPTAFLPPSRLHSEAIAPGVYVRDEEMGAGIEIWIEEVER